MPSSLLTKLATAVVIASAVLGVQADTYLGCTSSAPATEGDPAPYSAGAASSCSIFEDGTNTKGQCFDNQYTFYQRAETSFTFQGCYYYANPDHSNDQYLDTPAECFTYCRNQGTAVVTPFPMTDNYVCSCVAGSTINDAAADPANCDAYTQFAYTHSADAAASGLARRHMRERLEQLRLESQKLCPGQMKACKLEEMSDTYECVDTTSELESCGGCLFGEFGKDDAISPIGTDCSTLAGVSLGAATCRDSVCEAYACNRGYELVSGECVATVSA
ncbi:hypothetical protein IAU59_000094 [Kwoniella sp. CBS 9459]